MVSYAPVFAHARFHLLRAVINDLRIDVVNQETMRSDGGATVGFQPKMYKFWPLHVESGFPNSS